MELSKLLNVRIGYETKVKEKLLEMTTFFHNYMWDGSSDENDPKFLTKQDYEAIEALADKMEHMILNIGCPNSIAPMLQSIVARKLKHWQAFDNVETKDKTRYHYDYELKKGKTIIVNKGFKQGKQLRNNNDLRRVYSIDDYYHKEVQDRVISGHFRWNNRGYLLSRIATDALNDYLETKF